jgi:hypothetical protein
MATPEFFMLGTATKICKSNAGATACEAGAFTEDNCATLNYYKYHWKTTECVKCESATTGEGDGTSNATAVAVGLLSVLALIC